MFADTDLTCIGEANHGRSNKAGQAAAKVAGRGSLRAARGSRGVLHHPLLRYEPQLCPR
jgi:hypothetical protein